MNKHRTNGKSSPTKRYNLDRGVPATSVEARPPGRRAEAKLEFPAGEPDLDALRSATREWLVPLLVEKFLREQGVELRARPNTGPGKSPISDPWVGMKSH